MGFMDKAKKLAEQAQTKLDEVQKDFNEKQGNAPGGQQPVGAAVEYDAHGRKVTPPEDRLVPEPGPSHTQGDPADDFPSAPADTGPADTPSAAPEPPADKSPTFPPKPKQPPGGGSGMSSGDPLAG